MRFIFALAALLLSLNSAQAGTITPAFGKYSAPGGSVDAAKQNVNTMQVVGATFTKPGGKPTMTVTGVTTWLGASTDGTNSASTTAAMQAVLDSSYAVDSGEQHIFNLNGGTYAVSEIRLNPGQGLTNGTIKGSVLVGIETPGSPYNPVDMKNPQISYVHFTQDSLVNGTYALRYNFARYAGNVSHCIFDNFDKAIYVPTHATTTGQATYRVTFENNKYNNVNYFVYTDKPTSVFAGIADVHFVNNEGQSLLTGYRLHGVDGFTINSVTDFKPGWSAQSTTKLYNIDLDYASWGAITASNLFEAGLESILASHTQNISIGGGTRIAYPGQRVASSAIRFTNGDTSGSAYCLSSVGDVIIMFPTLSGIKVDSGCDYIDLAPKIVRSPGYPNYYKDHSGGSDAELAAMSHYYIDVDSSLANVGVKIGSFSGLNTFGVNGNVMFKEARAITLSGTETTVDVTGVTQINLAQSTPTTITELTGAESGQEILVIAYNSNSTLKHDSTGTNVNGFRLQNGVDLKMESTNGGIVLSSRKFYYSAGIGGWVDEGGSATGNVAIAGATSARQNLSIGAYLDLYSGIKNTPTVPSIRASSAGNLLLNASGTGAVFVNADGGTGGFNIYDGTNPVITMSSTGVILASKLNFTALHASPSSASMACTLGDFRVDSSYIYLCVATNTWKRALMSTW